MMEGDQTYLTCKTPSYRGKLIKNKSSGAGAPDFEKDGGLTQKTQKHKNTTQGHALWRAQGSGEQAGVTIFYLYVSERVKLQGHSDEDRFALAN